MVGVLAQVILPIALVVAVGWLAQIRLTLSAATLGELSIYVLQPCLVFGTLVGADFGTGAQFAVVGFTVLYTAVMGAVGWAVSRLAIREAVLRGPFMLCVAFPNLGNLGLAVVLFAHGEPGLRPAVVMLATQAILIGSVGVALVSNTAATLRGALTTPLKLPIVYAAAAAVSLNLTSTTVPAFVAEAVEIPRQAAIPIMLLLLGMSVAQPVVLAHRRELALAIAVRLLLGAAVGFGIASILQLEGVTQHVLIVLSAMPTAVVTTVLANRFQASPRFVSSAVVVSTAVSLLTVSLLLGALSGMNFWP